MNTTDNTNQKPRRRWLYGIPLVLLLAAAGSILYFEHAEREYEIGITGCESGGIELTDAGIFCGSLTIPRGRGGRHFQPLPAGGGEYHLPGPVQAGAESGRPRCASLGAGGGQQGGGPFFK